MTRHVHAALVRLALVALAACVPAPARATPFQDDPDFLSDQVCRCFVENALPPSGPVPRNLHPLIDGQHYDERTVRLLHVDQNSQRRVDLPFHLEQIGTSAVYMLIPDTELQVGETYVVRTTMRPAYAREAGSATQGAARRYDIVDYLDSTLPVLEGLAMQDQLGPASTECPRSVLHFTYDRASDDSAWTWLPLVVTFEQDGRTWGTMTHVATGSGRGSYIAHDIQVSVCAGGFAELTYLGFYGPVKVTAVLYDWAGHTTPRQTFEVDFGPRPTGVTARGCMIDRGTAVYVRRRSGVFGFGVFLLVALLTFRRRGCFIVIIR